MIVRDPQELALVSWYRTQMSEFVSRPQRWRAEITAEGSKISGELSKRHMVVINQDTGEIIVDGLVQVRIAVNRI